MTKLVPSCLWLLLAFSSNRRVSNIPYSRSSLFHTQVSPTQIVFTSRSLKYIVHSSIIGYLELPLSPTFLVSPWGFQLAVFNLIYVINNQSTFLCRGYIENVKKMYRSMKQCNLNTRMIWFCHIICFNKWRELNSLFYLRGINMKNILKSFPVSESLFSFLFVLHPGYPKKIASSRLSSSPSNE